MTRRWGLTWVGHCGALLVAVATVLPGSVWAQGSSQPAGADLVEVGRRIYRDGVLPSGQLLGGLGAAGVTLKGAQAACATCHRRSGYGSSEGTIEVRPITGPMLFGGSPVPTASAHVSARVADRNDATLPDTALENAKALRAARMSMFAGARPRPIYDDSTLERAILAGVDVTGRQMNVAMPRFNLDSQALAALTAYLKNLSLQTSPGVTDDKVHFATVIQPGATAEQRRALVEVLQAFVVDRNLSRRSEVRREETGVVRLRRFNREWVMHVWELTGSAETWGRQLEAFSERQPVFAMVSGLGDESWRPIHEFSERFEVPCILPQADLPHLADGDFYTVYLSKGATLEAQALAKFLQDSDERGPVVQVFRANGFGAVAADAFRTAWVAAGRAAPRDHVLDESPDQAYWKRLVQQNPQATWLLWLPARDLAHAQTLGAAASGGGVYLSSSLYSGPRTGLAADASGRVRLIYPQDMPAVREARLDVAKRWLTGKGISIIDEKLQLNAYLAMAATGMAVTHSVDTYSREFLLERLEHRLGTANELTIYPHLSLGPGQRFASKGSYIVEVVGADDRQLKLLSDWIVP